LVIIILCRERRLSKKSKIKEKARKDDPLRLSLMKKQHQFVCRDLLSSVETGGTPRYDHPKADLRMFI